MVTIPFGDEGLVSRQTDDFTTVELFTGDTPSPVTTPETVAASAISGGALPAFSVVGRASNGELVLAVHADASDPVAPIGITTAPVLQGATDRRVAVYRAGCFNPDALNWDESYSTDAEKRLAFEGSQPTIFIRKPEFSEA